VEEKALLFISALYALLCACVATLVLYYSTLTALWVFNQQIKMCGLLWLCHFLFLRLLFYVAALYKPKQ